MSAKQPSCEERISDELAARLTDIRDETPEFIDCANCDGTGTVVIEHNGDQGDCAFCEGTGEVENPAYDENESGPPEPLGIFSKRQTVVSIELSTGGPADGFRFTFDEDGDLERAEYYFQDWFDGATRKLDQDEAQAVIDAYGVYAEALTEQHRSRY
jgi:hypothetical protein